MTELCLHVAVSTPRSLEAVLKPIMDGLDPFLVRDPSARVEFTPNVAGTTTALG